MKLLPSFNTISGCVDGLTIKEDPIHLNWLKGHIGFGTPFGSFYTDKIEKSENRLKVIYEYFLLGVTLTVERKTVGDNYRETYTFENTDKEDVEIERGKIGIYVPFNNDYDIPFVTFPRRCHAHVWCGGSCSYIYGLRADGGDNNVGLVVTQGEINEYGIERKINEDMRGDIIFYVPPIMLKPKESYTLEWELFAFKDVRDFFDKASDYDPFINIQSKHFACAKGETLTLTADRFIDYADIDGEEIPPANTKAGAKLLLSFKEEGEKKLTVRYGKNCESYAYFYVFSSIGELIDKRIDFIINYQQILDSDSPYLGAYALYDNETSEPFIIPGEKSEMNACKERAGMTALILSRLIKGIKDIAFKDKLTISVNKSIDFIRANIVAPDGTVFDEIGAKSLSARKRELKSYAYYSTIFAMLYELNGDIKDIEMSMRIIERYYSLGGADYYAFGLPMMRIFALAERDNLMDIGMQAKKLFLTHGNRIIERGQDIPRQENRFSHTVIAAATEILLSCYNISGDSKYLTEAGKFMNYLLAMNGFMSDYRMRDIAIRHWDSYKSGKAKIYADQFPHYKSCYTAAALALYGNAAGNNSFSERADNILRNNLCLFDEEGRASSGYVYPSSINGKKGAFYDPYSNDQDWALYYMLEYSSEMV